jgi:hypothetical protein
MLRAVWLWALKAAFALTLFAGPASAVTFVDIVPGNTNIGGLPYDLLQVAVYSYNSPTFGAGVGIDHVFEFQYAPPPDVGAGASAAINDISYFYPMDLKWWYNRVDNFGAATLAQASVASASPGADINTILSLANGAGFYWLELAGTAGPKGGQYNVSVATTPLPAAAWLFGSVFAGGLGLMRLRGRRKLQAA